MKHSATKMFILFGLSLCLFLTSCNVFSKPETTPSAFGLQSEETPFPVPTVMPTLIQPVISTKLPQKIPSQTPSLNQTLSLTYIHKKEGSSIYSIPISCITSEEICFGEPQEIYKFSSGDFDNLDGFIATLSKTFWSSDGSNLLTSAIGRNGRSDIYIWNAKDMNWVNLTNSPEDDYGPQWSPDGTKIYYIANSLDTLGNFGNPHLYLYDLKDGVHTMIPIDKELSSFSVSPDGKKIAFSAGDINGHDQLYLANIDGSGIQKVTSSDSDNRHPSFSPNSRRIAFVRSVTKPTDEGFITLSHIYIKDLDANNEINLSETLESEVVYPTFSPDGNWVSFYSVNTRIKSSDLFVVSLEQKKLIQISHASGYGDKYIFPSWRIP